MEAGGPAADAGPAVPGPAGVNGGPRGGPLADDGQERVDYVREASRASRQGGTL